MMKNMSVGIVFLKSDEVVPAIRSHLGTPGILIRLNPDVDWAEITERNRNLRSYRVEWLAHSMAATPGIVNEGSI